jgi:hypothetical protein
MTPQFDERVCQLHGFLPHSIWFDHSPFVTQLQSFAAVGCFIRPGLINRADRAPSAMGCPARASALNLRAISDLPTAQGLLTRSWRCSPLFFNRLDVLADDMMDDGAPEAVGWQRGLYL